MDRKYAEYLLKKTKEDYNLIAKDFSRTRERAWPEIKFLFNNYLISGEKVLDLGCGNGRYFEFFSEKDVDYFGVDSSEKLIEIARERNPKAKFQVADALNLPFPNNFFDKVYSIAVFHHIPSEEFRIRFLKEIKRVLKSEGLLILTVWNLNPLKMILIGQWQRAFSFFKFSILKIFGKTKLDFGDFYIPWRGSWQRYVHCFTKSELKKLIEKSDFELKEMGVLKSLKTKESNIYLVAKK